MADLLNNMLGGMQQGMQNPLFGMGVGILAGNGLGQGLQQGWKNMQVMRELQQRQDQATSMLNMRTQEMRQKRYESEKKAREQQAVATRYGVAPGTTPTSAMLNAGALPGNYQTNLQEQTRKQALVNVNTGGGGDSTPRILAPEQVQAAGLPQGTVAQVDKNGMIKVVESGNEESTAYQKHEQIQQSYDSYVKRLKDYGTQIVPGAEKAILKSQYNDLLLEAKEMYNLGVLNGPDLEIMNQVMADPTIWQSQIYSGDDLVRQMEGVFGEKLKAARGRLDDRYGRSTVPDEEIINFEDLR